MAAGGVGLAQMPFGDAVETEKQMVVGLVVKYSDALAVMARM